MGKQPRLRFGFLRIPSPRHSKERLTPRWIKLTSLRRVGIPTQPKPIRRRNGRVRSRTWSLSRQQSHRQTFCPNLPGWAEICSCCSDWCRLVVKNRFRPFATSVPWAHRRDWAAEYCLSGNGCSLAELVIISRTIWTRQILTLSAGFSRKVLQLVASQRISTSLLKYPLLELFDKNIVVFKTQRIDRASLGRVVYDRVQAMTRTYLFWSFIFCGLCGSIVRIFSCVSWRL